LGRKSSKTTQYKLVVTSDVAAGLVKRVNAGDPFDVFAGTPAQIDMVIKDSEIVAAARTNLVRSGIGVQVRTAAPETRH
jgi:hypothetical protein